MREIEVLFEAVARHADGVFRTDGRGRVTDRAGRHTISEDDAIRLDLLVDGAEQLGVTWDCGACGLVMIMFAKRVVVVAVLPDGGHLAVIAKPDAQPGILLSYVRRALAAGEDAEFSIAIPVSGTVANVKVTAVAALSEFEFEPTQAPGTGDGEEEFDEFGEGLEE